MRRLCGVASMSRVTNPKDSSKTPRAQQEFTAALRRLYDNSGYTSFRTLAGDMGPGAPHHTTITETVRGRSLPHWGKIEAVVRHLGGDVIRLQELWLKAHDEREQFNKHAKVTNVWRMVCAVCIRGGIPPEPAIAVMDGDTVCTRHAAARRTVTIIPAAPAALPAADGAPAGPAGPSARTLPRMCAAAV